MTTDDKLLEDYEDDPECGVDAASDKGYWLEKASKRASDLLIEWRKEAGLSPELLSELAPIPLEEYLQIERGERSMTNGDAWRIDKAITEYRSSKETWLQRIWRRGWLARCRYKLRIAWDPDVWAWRDILSIAAGSIIYVALKRGYLYPFTDILIFFLRSAFTVGIPACIAVWLVRWIIKELRRTE